MRLFNVITILFILTSCESKLEVIQKEIQSREWTKIDTVVSDSTITINYKERHYLKREESLGVIEPIDSYYVSQIDSDFVIQVFFDSLHQLKEIKTKSEIYEYSLHGATFTDVVNIITMPNEELSWKEEK